MITWNQWLNYATARLKNVLVSNSRLEARMLLEFVVGVTHFKIIVFSNTYLTAYQYKKLNFLLKCREKGEPIFYLIGKRDFWSLSLKINRYVFIPRSDTECLVEVVLGLVLSEKASVLDLGSGAGTISLALASEKSTWCITGVDCVKTSVILANENSKLLKLKNVFFIQGNWFSSVKKKKYDLIVSNPPYISLDDIHLSLGDLRFEPRIALVAKNNGLENLNYICSHSSMYLKDKGWLVLEHGWKQYNSVRFFFKRSGFANIETIYDYSNHPRVTKGQFLKGNK